MWKLGLIYLDLAASFWIVWMVRLAAARFGSDWAALAEPIASIFASSVVIVASVFAWRDRAPWAIAICMVALAIPITAAVLTLPTLLLGLLWLPRWLGALVLASLVVNAVSLVAVIRAGRS